MKFRLTAKTHFHAATKADCMIVIKISLGLCTLGASSVWAQTPTDTSPNTATPYSWSMFHAGGPVASSASTPPPGSLYTALQGTPSGLFTIPGAGYTLPSGTIVPTQIPSFLLGNYDPARPPSGLGLFVLGQGTTPYSPNNFFDQYVFNSGLGIFDVTQPTSQYEMIAPYAYLQQGAGTVSTDDSDISPAFTPTAGFAVGADAATLASSTSSSYHVAAPGTGTENVVWQIPVAGAGIYRVTAHIPKAPVGNTLIADAHYSVTYTDPNGIVQGPTPVIVNQGTGATSINVNLMTSLAVAANTNIIVTLTDQSASAIGTDVILADSAAVTPVNGTNLTIDDDNTFNPAGIDQFTNPDPGTETAWAAGIADNTATNQAYTRLLATTATTGAAVSHVSWNFTVGQAGSYDVYMHIPDASNTSTTETRVTNAHYRIIITDAANTNNNGTFDAQVSQTDANSLQLVGGTFTVSAGATIKVLLDNSSSEANGTTSYVVADSMTLQLNSSGVLNGSPVAINAIEYPEINNAYYYGVLNGTVATQDPIPHGYSAPGTIDYTTTPPVYMPLGTPPNIAHEVRQLVYFGRSELYTDPISKKTQRVGFIYCVDGFTADVVWRFRTQLVQNSVVNQTDGAPFTTPAIARIKVDTADSASISAVQTRLVVIVGDNSGKLYCLDAVGNRDGGNSTTLSDQTNSGTTTPYWIYRPDPSKPKTVSLIAVPPAAHDVAANTLLAPNTDLPVPASFGSASPVVVVNPSTLQGIVYIGDSHGTMYAFDATGVAASQGTDTSDDPFNVPLVFGNAYDVVRTPKPLWWLMTRSPGANNTSNADIESAPAVYVQDTPDADWDHTIYFGTAHETEPSSNVGRLYAVDSGFGTTTPNLPPPYGPLDSTGSAHLRPGTPNYNVAARAKWAFPDLYGTGQSVPKSVRPGLGNITGSPVVFRIPASGLNLGPYTRVYFAANSGLEVPTGGSTPDPRPAADETGRLWALDIQSGATEGKMVWSFPSANDPNVAALDSTPEPSEPIGAFLNATPSLGLVQFPQSIQYYDGSGSNTVADYMHSDATGVDVKTRQVPMLYIGTAGATDKGFYALDLDSTGSGVAADTQALIYRWESQSGNIFQSSPALVTNPSTTGGNGGVVYFTLGNSLYQLQATPSTNLLDQTGQDHPLVGVDAQFEGFGPISSPALAAAEVIDVNASTAATKEQDWIYVCDNSTGYLHGVTPGFKNGVGIDLTSILPTPPPFIEPPLRPINYSATLHTHIFDGRTIAHPSNSVDITQANPGDGTADTPVFEWGDNVYIRISNVVPPNPGDIDARLRIPAPGGAYYYSNGSAITFQLTDTDPQGNAINSPDSGVIPGVLLFNPPVSPTPLTAPTVATSTDLPGNGFVERFDAPAGDEALVTAGAPVNAAPIGFLGAYTYAIRDGSNRQNTPASQRRILNARQVAEVHRNSDNSLVGTIVLESTASSGNPVIDPATGRRRITQPTYDPTFSILNPLAVAAGGTPVNYPANSSAELGIPNALWTTGEIGPFRPVASPLALTDLQALTNGNQVLTSVPKGGISGGNPTLLQAPPVPGSPNKVSDTIISTTGMINHGYVGDNALLPKGTNIGQLRGYGLSVADRSQLNAAGQALQITMQKSSLSWNGTPINPLIWDSLPVIQSVGANRSVDYPDISSRRTSFTLDPAITAADITGKGHVITGMSPAGPAIPVAIKTSISMPKYQPASVTTFTQGGTFPAGYLANERIFVDSNHNGRFDRGEAYRFVNVQSGVPIDMSTSIVENVTDVGKVPAGFGVQTSGDPLVGPFEPNNPINNAGFVNSFRSVTVHNNGNVNLLNVHFDQKLLNSPFVLNLVSDAVDNASDIAAYDNYGLTGAPTFLLRSSLDTDYVGTHSLNQHSLSGGAPTAYTGATFHKPRPGDTAPTTLTVPDLPHDNYGLQYTPTTLVPTLPKISVAVPLGTPVGTYSQTVRLFEGTDTTYNWLLGPTYNTALDKFAIVGGQTLQPYSNPGTTVKVTVTENRLTHDTTSHVSAGTLAHLPTASAPAGATFSPAAFRDSYWNSGGLLNGTGNLVSYFTAPSASPAYSLYGFSLPFHMSDTSSAATSYGYFTAASAASWWSQLTSFPVVTDTTNSVVSVAQEQEQYQSVGDTFTSGGFAYAFVQNYLGTATGAQNRLYCLQLNTGGAGAGTLRTAFPLTGVIPNSDSRVITSDISTTKYGLRGLKFSNANINTPINVGNNTVFRDTNSGTDIKKDLWAFWYTGTRGRTAISFSAASTDNSGVIQPISPGSADSWLPQSTLPIAAGLSSVSDPNPLFVQAPSFDAATGVSTLIPAIEVTYTGVAPNGNSDIYVSRYRPYHPMNNAGTVNNAQTLMQLVPSPPITEELRPDANKLWWQARDVGWLRNNQLNINVGGAAILRDTAGVLLTNVTATYDQQSGIWAFTGTTSGTVYIDVQRGRVRFSQTIPTGKAVTVTTQSMARRITTDAQADSTPVAFLDNTWKENASNIFVGGFHTVGRIQTDRMWYFWRKSGGSNPSSTPTLYYTDRRLTVVLPSAIAVNANGLPIIKVTDPTSSTVLYDSTGTNPMNAIADVDAVRGRIYFPINVADVPTEGRKMQIDYTPKGSAATVSQESIVNWLQEPRYNDPTSGATPASTSSDTVSASDVFESPVPLDTAINESGVAALLDPWAYANVKGGSYNPLIPTGNALPTPPTLPNPQQPSKIWLFWTTTRNSTPDLYSATLNPRFAPLIGQ